MSFRRGRTLIKTIICKGLMAVNNIVTVKGWIRTVRKQKPLFIKINDGTCFFDLQIVIDKEHEEKYSSVISQLSSGASIEVKGEIVESPSDEQEIEIQLHRIKLLGAIETPSKYPLSKKRHTLEHLRKIPHLRARTSLMAVITRIRNRVAMATHEFFQNLDFKYINTPLITSSDCEGAGETFVVEAKSLAKELKEDVKELIDKPKEDELSEETTISSSSSTPTTPIPAPTFFDKPAYLTVSGQLNLEGIAHGMGDVYTFGPTFRAEKSNSSRHLAEFWMIEPEIVFATIDDVMDLAEDYLKAVTYKVLSKCRADLEFLEKYIEKNLINKLLTTVNQEIKRISYEEAMELLISVKDQFDIEPKVGEDLASEHEKFLTKKFGTVIVYNYPKEIKAFYMKVNKDNKTVAAMDLLVPEIGELIGGSEREESYDKLLKRIKELNLDPKQFSWYLDLRRYGTVPHGGFGLGFERFIMFLTGMKNIKDVIPYPRAYKHLSD